MAYERNDRGYRGDQGGYGRDRDHGRDRDFGRERGYGRQPQGYSNEDRGFFDRAGDEVRSWFGDEDAERRRRLDEREDDQRGDRGYDRDNPSYGRGYAPFGQREDRYRGSAGREGYGANRSAGRGYGSERNFGGDRGAGYGGRNNDRDDERTYGQGSPSNYGQQSQRRHHDESYRTWRDRQMESFDRDFEDYRRENQSRFESDFTAWRTNREGQRSQLRQVREHQEVVGSDGQHIGTVDHVQGDQIKLAKNDKDAGGQHHFVPCSWINQVGDKVTLSRTASEAKQHWTDEARNSGGQMFGRDETGADKDQSEAGGRNLNKSFSGTY